MHMTDKSAHGTMMAHAQERKTDQKPKTQSVNINIRTWTRLLHACRSLVHMRARSLLLRLRLVSNFSVNEMLRWY